MQTSLFYVTRTHVGVHISQVPFQTCMGIWRNIDFFMLFVHVLESENWVFRSLKTERYKILQMVFWSEGAPLSTSSSFIPLYAFLTCMSCTKKLFYLSLGQPRWKLVSWKAFWKGTVCSVFFPTYTLFEPLHSACWRRLCGAFSLPTLFCMLGADMAWACLNGPLKFPPSEVVIKPALGRNDACVEGNAGMVEQRCVIDETCYQSS